MKVAD